jgi:hypothetical protein
MRGVPCDVLCDVGMTWEVLLYAYGDCVKMDECEAWKWAMGLFYATDDPSVLGVEKQVVI